MGSSAHRQPNFRESPSRESATRVDCRGDMSRRDGSVYLPLSLADGQGSPVAESTLFLKSRDSHVVSREAGSWVDR